MRWLRRREPAHVDSIVDRSNTVAELLAAAVAAVPRPDPWTTPEEACRQALNTIAARPEVLLWAEQVINLTAQSRSLHAWSQRDEVPWTAEDLLIAASDYARLVPLEVLT